MTKSVKNRLDKWFSRFIRLRDSNDMGVLTCISCKTPHHWKKAHAGHFVGRGRMSTRWNEKNVNGQCVKCNTFTEGNKWNYGKGLEKKYGEGTPGILEAEGHRIKRWSDWEGEELIKHYKVKVKELENALRA